MKRKPGRPKGSKNKPVAIDEKQCRLGAKIIDDIKLIISFMATITLLQIVSLIILIIIK